MFARTCEPRSEGSPYIGSSGQFLEPYLKMPAVGVLDEEPRSAGRVARAHAREPAGRDPSAPESLSQSVPAAIQPRLRTAIVAAAASATITRAGQKKPRANVKPAAITAYTTTIPMVSRRRSAGPARSTATDAPYPGGGVMTAFKYGA